jgi:hypothetical protein
LSQIHTSNLKNHFWSNRAYADDEALEAAALTAWRKAVLDDDLLKTVCAAAYAKGGTSDRRAHDRHLELIRHSWHPSTTGVSASLYDESPSSRNG